MQSFSEPLTGLFTQSRNMILDFANIPQATPKSENIAQYFRDLEASGQNPRQAQYRQAFNDRLISRYGCRYLVSSFGEDRKSMLEGSAIALQGRTIHLGIDIFATDLETVFAPCDGTIVRTGREQEAHSFGNYLIFRPNHTDLPLLFFGHLGFNLPPTGYVKQGEPIGVLGDFRDNENGGWSRHLHLQCLRDMPKKDEVPIGYGSLKRLPELFDKYPDPMKYFNNWNIR